MVATGTLTGTYQRMDGTPAVGSVFIAPNVPVVRDTLGKVVLSGGISVALDANGSFSQAVPATDGADVDPIGVTYTVHAGLRHGNLADVTGISVPTAATVNLSDVTSTAATPPTSDTFIPKPTASDGQLLAYSATLGRWTASNPVGQSELTAAVNTSGTVTALSANGGPGTIVAIAGTSIVVPASTRPVTLHYQASFNQTTAGDGSLFLLVYDVTGTATLVGFVGARLNNSTAAALSGVVLPQGIHRIGTLASSRTYELRAYIYAAVGSAPAGSIKNATTSPTTLQAIAG